MLVEIVLESLLAVEDFSGLQQGEKVFSKFRLRVGEADQLGSKSGCHSTNGW